MSGFKITQNARETKHFHAHVKENYIDKAKDI
jgi:hypothetical protein